MAEEIPLFVEDSAQAGFFRGLVERIAAEFGVEVDVKPRFTGRRGSRVYRDAADFLRDLGRQSSMPRFVVVGVDANCKGVTEARRKLDEAVVHRRPDGLELVRGFPDPHVERWFLLDPIAFGQVTGRSPPSKPAYKCARDHYKNLLREALGTDGALAGAELGGSLAKAIDLNRCADDDDSLKRFLAELRAALRP